jgi:phosphatidylserine/phosphatidylglycerophosphate/cardiolipin synthase-like enzyme
MPEYFAGTVQEIRRMRDVLRRKPVTENGKAVLFPRGTVVLIIVLAAMFTVPWVLAKVTEYNERHWQAGRGAGATVGGAQPRARSAGAGSARQRAAVSSGGDLGLGGQYEIYYSPDENLEKEDVAVIGEARERIDAALYSATDYAVCDALASAARRGVKVRVYRDREQYQEEINRAHGRQTCTGELVGAGVVVAVKGSTELMHLKSYAVDGKVLRSGSANVSESGERRQDNDVIFMGSPAAVNGFERQFESIWERGDNQVVSR